MKSVWKVTTNWVGDEKMYGVYRLRNVDEVDHSGNREFHGGYVGDKGVAQGVADALNEVLHADDL